MLLEIYPDQESRKALEVFCVVEGCGEYFDLSTKPITRGSFVVGEHKGDSGEVLNGYHITETCSGCGKCVSVCPQKCIDTGSVPFQIRQEHCLHCGNCMEVCPAGAVKYQKREA